MSLDEAYKNFAKILENNAGPPDGRTDEVVELELRDIYSTIFEAVITYGQLLHYQSSTASIDVKFQNINRSNRSALCILGIADDGQRLEIPIHLTADTITVRRGHLAQQGTNGPGNWTVDDQEDFAGHLGTAILLAAGYRV